MLRKLGKSNQVAIPKKIMSVLRLKKDDYLDIYIENNKIILKNLEDNSIIAEFKPPVSDGKVLINAKIISVH